MSLDVGVVGKNLVRNDGQGRAVLELVKVLISRDHHVTVYAHRVDPEIAADVTLRLLPVAPGPTIVDDLTVLLRATYRVRRARHDVTCVLGPTALPRSPFVFDAQFSHRAWRRSGRDGVRPPLTHRLHSLAAATLEGMVAARSNAVIASTEQVGTDVLNGARVPVVAVPLGIDPLEHQIPSDHERQEARQRFGVGPGEVVLAFLGGFSTGRKGLEPLLDAVAAGTETLLVAGTGDRRPVERRIAELGISDRVRLLGFVPANEVLAAADVAVVPSLYEPFSLVGIEAAARAIPVAISRVAGVSPFLGDSAVVIDDASQSGQIRAALDVLCDPGERRRRGAAGPAAAAALTWAEITQAAADAVEAVAAGAIR